MAASETRRRRVGVAAFAAAALAVGVPAGAHACTCAEQTPSQLASLVRANEGAFVGALLGHRLTDPAGASRARFRFRVDRSYKCALRDRIWVQADDSSAACGLGDLARNHGVGVILIRRGGEWESNRCLVTTPRKRRRAVRDARKTDKVKTLSAVTGACRAALRA